MADTVFLTLIIISTCLNLLVYTPILIYWILRVLKFRDSFVIKKRLPTLLITLIILSIVYFCVEKTLQLWTFGNLMDPKWKRISNKIIFYLFQIPFVYFLWFYVLRFWLLFYKLEWSLSMMNNEWKSIINHNNASDDWFILHKRKYGSLRYLGRRLVIICSVIAIFVVITWVLFWESIEPNGYSVWIMYILFVFFPPTIVLFVVAYMLPQFSSRSQLKRTFFSLENRCREYTVYLFLQSLCTLSIHFPVGNWSKIQLKSIKSLQIQLRRLFGIENRAEIFVLWLYRSDCDSHRLLCCR